MSAEPILIDDDSRAFRGLAARSSGWQDVHAAADAALPRMKRLARDMLVAAREAVSEDALTAAIEEHHKGALEYVLNPATIAMQRAVGERLVNALLGIVTHSGQLAAERASRTGTFEVTGLEVRQARISLAFDFIDPQVVAWARRHAGELIREISNGSRLAIQALVTDALNRGVAPRTLAMWLRPQVGLTRYQTQLVENLRKQIIANPGKLIRRAGITIRVPRNVTKEYAYGRTTRYAEWLHRDRVEMIARTETMRASNQGLLETWRQAREKDLLDSELVKVWIVTPDDRLCEVCAAFDGITAEVNGDFENGFGSPPVHPRCRCAMGLIQRSFAMRKAKE